MCDPEENVRQFLGAVKEILVLARSRLKHVRMLQREMNQIRYSLGLLNTSGWTQSQLARVRYKHGEVSGAVERLRQEHYDCKQALLYERFQHLCLIRKFEPERFERCGFDETLEEVRIALGYKKQPKPKASKEVG